MCRGTQPSSGTKTAKKNTRKIVPQNIVPQDGSAKDRCARDRSAKDRSAKDWLVQDRLVKDGSAAAHGTNRLFQCSGGVSKNARLRTKTSNSSALHRFLGSACLVTLWKIWLEPGPRLTARPGLRLEDSFPRLIASMQNSCLHRQVRLLPIPPIPESRRRAACEPLSGPCNTAIFSFSLAASSFRSPARGCKRLHSRGWFTT